VRHRLPEPLADHLIAVTAPAGAAVLLGLVALVITVSNALAARSFERSAEQAVAVVVADPPGQGRLEVRFTVGASTVTALAPTVDPAAYEIGQEVGVWFDADDPTEVRLTTEPYDLATPLAASLGLIALGSLAAVARWRRVQRLQRLAASGDDAWAFRGEVVDRRTWYGLDRPWLELHALDASPHAPPVASIPLLRHQACVPGSDQAVVRGDVRAGGTAVANLGGCVLWPSGSVRVP
jgi:hypothetical protein